MTNAQDDSSIENSAEIIGWLIAHARDARLPDWRLRSAGD